MTATRWVTWDEDAEVWATVPEDEMHNAKFLRGVPLDAPINGRVPMYNSGTGRVEWVSVGGGGPHALGDHTDVALGTLSDNEVLTYETATGKWKNTAAPSAASVGADPVGSAAAVAGDLSTHEGLANPHGTTAADVGADAAGTAAAAVSGHAGLATGVHGVGASTIESVSGSASKVSTHSGLATGVHGVGASTVASASDVSGAVSAHSGLGTGVHGVGGSTVASAADVSGAVSAHLSGAPHIVDAPSDGTQYARKNAGWEAVAGGGLTYAQAMLLVYTGMYQ